MKMRKSSRSGRIRRGRGASGRKAGSEKGSQAKRRGEEDGKSKGSRSNEGSESLPDRQCLPQVTRFGPWGSVQLSDTTLSVIRILSPVARSIHRYHGDVEQPDGALPKNVGRPDRRCTIAHPRRSARKRSPNVGRPGIRSWDAHRCVWGAG